MTFPVFDSHCHLDAKAFDEDRDAVVARAAAAGVIGVVLPATDRDSSDKIVTLLDTLTALEAYGAVGVHPHEAASFSDEVMAHIEGLTRHPRVVAVGETGLDYYYDFSPREAQQASLRAHVRLARTQGLPLVLHCRDAEADLLSILDAEGAAQCGGVVHCFTGTAETAQRLLGMGFYLGFTGIITFRTADALREVVKMTPLSRILVETDSPYLAPIPYRGKRNEPAYVAKVAEVVGQLHGTSAAEAAASAADNTRRCLRLPARP